MGPSHSRVVNPRKSRNNLIPFTLESPVYRPRGVSPDHDTVGRRELTTPTDLRTVRRISLLQVRRNVRRYLFSRPRGPRS